MTRTPLSAADRVTEGPPQVTNTPWMFRAAVTGVALAAVTATFAAFAVAQALEGPRHSRWAPR